jgi:hypothetical protein
MVYAALTPEAAVAETITPFSRKPGLGASIDPSRRGDEPSPVWLEDRILATGELGDAHVVDVTSHLAEILMALGMPTDKAGTAPDRLTQALARTVYQIRNESGHPRFDGILYIGRAAGAEMVAMFSDRVEIDAVTEVPLTGRPPS